MKTDRKYITPLAGLITILLASLVIIGWVYNVSLLKSMLPGSISMKFNTALCFLMLGLAMVLLRNQKARPAVVLLAIVIIVMSLVTMIQYVWQINIGIDELFWKEGPGTIHTIYPGRMSEAATLHFMLMGIVLIILPDRRSHFFIHFAFLVIIFISTLAFLSYVFGVSFLNSLPVLTKLALPTAICFIIVCLGIYYSDLLVTFQISFQKKLIGGFLFILFLLAIIVFMYKKNNEHFIHTGQLVELTNSILYQSEKVQSSLTDMESGVRGFLLTNDESFLEHYHIGKSNVLKHIEKIKLLTSGNPIQQSRIDSLIIQVEQRFIQGEKMIGFKKAVPDLGKQPINTLFENKKFMDKLRERINSIQSTEIQLLDKRKSDNEITLENSVRIIYFLVFILILLLWVMLAIIYSNFNARKLVELQLKNANKELEAFSYSVSHDLRAPLRGIDGWSLALSEDYGHKLDEKAQQYISRVRKETQRMGDLIDDILKLSQVSRMVLNPTYVNLSEMAEVVCGRLEEYYAPRAISFHIQRGLQAIGDARLLDILLTNLLSNACKFTGKTTHARIEFGKVVKDNRESYFIRDNGVGFNMENAKNLFGAFQRMHKQTDFPGTGIGLATVQRIIHLHNGNIWAESSPNQGATFYFTLPK